jgi:hypothetical protein
MSNLIWIGVAVVILVVVLSYIGAESRVDNGLTGADDE